MGIGYMRSWNGTGLKGSRSKTFTSWERPKDTETSLARYMGCFCFGEEMRGAVRLVDHCIGDMILLV
jgi:hypothetical protein